VKSITVADVNNDAVLDLLVARADGAIVRLSDKNEGEAWDTAEIARDPNPSHLAGEVRLRVADLDNNGSLDLVLASVAPGHATGAQVWLSDEK